MKKINLWKHLTAVLLCLMLFVQPMTVLAEAPDSAKGEVVLEDVVKTGQCSFVTPGYEGISDSAGNSHGSEETVPAAGAAETRAGAVFTSEADCVKYLRSELVKRNRTVSFSMKNMYIGDLYAWSLKMYNMVMNDNGKTKVYEGDYLRWNTLRVDTRYSYNNYQGWYDFTWYMQYCSTAAQETYVNKKIPSIVSSLKLDGKSDYEKVKACYDYVTKNVTYDYLGLYLGTPDCHSCYNAIRYKKAVCQGYATFMYRLMRQCKIPCRIIAGNGNGEAHGWNIVKLGNYYYNLDSTWDAGQSRYNYFLKNMSEFKGHARYAEYTTAAFYKTYPMAAKSYVPSAAKPGTPKLGIAKGVDYNKIKISWEKVPGASGYYIYRKTAGSSWSKIGKAGSTAITYTDGKVSFGKTYTYTVRAYETISGKTVLSNYNTTGISGKTTSLGKTSKLHSIIYPGDKAALVWKKVNGAHGYEIWRKSDLETKYIYLGELKYTDRLDIPELDFDYGCTNTGVKLGREYIYGVRAYRVYGGKRYYGKTVYSTPVVIEK